LADLEFKASLGSIARLYLKKTGKGEKKGKKDRNFYMRRWIFLF
jgi:hypothetical protein